MNTIMMKLVIKLLMLIIMGFSLNEWSQISGDKHEYNMMKPEIKHLLLIIVGVQD